MSDLHDAPARLTPDATPGHPMTEQPALREQIAELLRAKFDWWITAEWVCCDPPKKGHKLCRRGRSALRMVRALLADNGEDWPPTSPIIDALMDLIEGLPNRGYCEHCGRGDCAPTAAQWDEQRQRAEKAERQAMGFRRLKDVYVRERNAAYAELIKAEEIIEALCDDRDAGVGMAKAALTEQRERAQQAEEHAAYLDEEIITPERALHQHTIRRLEQAQDRIRLAHETINRSEAERAHAVQRAEHAEARAKTAEAAIQRVRDLHHDEDGSCSACMDAAESSVAAPCATIIALDQPEDS